MTDPRIGAAHRRALRCCMVATGLAAVAGRASAQTASAPGAAIGPGPQSIRINPENVRLNNYLHDLAGRGAIVGMVGGGVIDQLRNTSGGPDDLPGRIAERATEQAASSERPPRPRRRHASQHRLPLPAL